MILQPKSAKGWRLLQKHGNEWLLIKKQPSVHFSDRPGPWAMVQPLEGDDMDVRWIHLSEDRDFVIVR